MKNRLITIFTFVLFLIFLMGVRYLRVSGCQNSIVIYLLGSAPNFIAGFFISISFPLQFAKSQTKRQVTRNFFLFSSTVLLTLILEEFIPIFGKSYVFDLNDILFSFIGCLLAFFCFHMYLKNELHFKDN
jgi:hypothetical protein